MSATLRAPFPWFGGKSRAADIIWQRLGADVINFVEPFFATRCRHGVPEWATLGDIQAALPAYPSKVVTTKLASMVRRGVIYGCACGCRGDFGIPP